MAVCSYHPDQPGIGICMRCRLVICAACCTKVAGINHCHACLKELGRRQERPSSRAVAARFLAVLVLGLTWLVFFGVAWVLQGVLAP